MKKNEFRGLLGTEKDVWEKLVGVKPGDSFPVLYSCSAARNSSAQKLWIFLRRYRTQEMYAQAPIEFILQKVGGEAGTVLYVTKIAPSSAKIGATITPAAMSEKPKPITKKEKKHAGTKDAD
ncbi:MAG: hypothetical protein WC449_05325 [Candidatus Paceibacterota bacterium]